MATVQRLYITTSTGAKTYLDANSVNAVSKGTTATTQQLGLVKVGKGLSITSDGSLYVDGTSGGSGSIATTTTAGVVKVGGGLNIDADGVLSANVTTLPIATNNVLGIVQIAEQGGLAITKEGKLSVDIKQVDVISTLPYATVEAAGVVKPDGTTVVATTDGTISTVVPVATEEQTGVMQVGDGLTVTEKGEVSVKVKAPISIVNNELQLPDYEEAEFTVTNAAGESVTRTFLVKKIVEETTPDTETGDGTDTGDDTNTTV